MNRNKIIEAAYETIKQNLEWGVGSTDAAFASYVDGVVGMTDTLLEMIEPPTKEKDYAGCVVGNDLTGRISCTVSEFLPKGEPEPLCDYDRA